MPGNFFDTNVLLYTVSSDDPKADRAERLLLFDGVISVQVLNEIASVARRKMRFSWARTHLLLSRMQRLLPTVPLTVDIHRAGIALAERYGLSVYDGMILAAALDAGCDVVFSEDMQHGLVVENRLRIVNPFAAAN